MRLAVTSSDSAQQKLGKRNWRRLHTIGSYYIWLIFSLSYLPRVFDAAAYIPFASLLVGALGLRVSRRVALRSRRERRTCSLYKGS